MGRGSGIVCPNSTSGLPTAVGSFGGRRRRSRDESQGDRATSSWFTRKRTTVSGQDRIPRDTRRARHRTTPRRPAVRRRPAEHPTLARRRSPRPLRRRHCAPPPGCGAVTVDQVEQAAVAIPARTNGSAKPEPPAPLLGRAGAGTVRRGARRGSRPRRPRSHHRRKGRARSPRGPAAGRAAILGALIFTSAAVRLPGGPTANITAPWPTRRRRLAAGMAPARARRSWVAIADHEAAVNRSVNKSVHGPRWRVC